MKYLYLFLELILYSAVGVLFWFVFSRYRYRKAFERQVEEKPKAGPLVVAGFLGTFGASVGGIVWLWSSLHSGQPHHMGYFLAFLTGTVLALSFFRTWVDNVDLALCIPSMIIVWILLLSFESILLSSKAGWIYTDSTVFSIRLGPNIEIILENLIFFYLFSPFMSILIFTALAYKRSDISAFLWTNCIIWATGVVWEVICMGVFDLWYMAEERSVWAFTILGARTTIEEMFYYVPFASLSILIYLILYYRKYRYYTEVSPQTAK
jgi:hypothetical protein